MGSRWTWRLVALPGVVWLSVFFLVAFYTVLAVAFGNQDTLSQPVPHWNPLDWNVGYVIDMLDNFLHGGPFWTVSLRTIQFVAIAVALSLLVGYPVAYFTARHAGRWKGADPARADPSALDQLPDADAGVDQPAGAGRDRLAVPPQRRNRVAVPLARAARTSRVAGSTASRSRSSSRCSTATSRSSSCRCSSRSIASTAARSTRPATSVRARRARSSA